MNLCCWDVCVCMCVFLHDGAKVSAPHGGKVREKLNTTLHNNEHIKYPFTTTL